MLIKTTFKAQLARSFFELGLSPSKNSYLICFNESPLKMMKNVVFFFILKSLFLLKIFTFLSLPFGHVEKNGKLGLISKFMASKPG